MGFLKKITRPISRVLDKIVPNEIKPALPFLAAAAPFMAPGLMSLGGNTMFSRALISGGLNLGSQLAQEGSDGDFSGLSTLMAAATGALSTPGSAGGRTIGDTGKSYSQYMGGDSLASTGTQSAGDFFKNKALGMEPGFAKSGLGALEGTSNYLTGVSDTLQNNLFSKEGLKAALVPVGQGMTDLAVAENRRAMKDYEREQADYEAGMDEENSNRAFAIRQSMEAYGFTEQEILDAIEAAGYRAGGRVGFEFGGIPAAVEGVEEKPKEFLVDKLKVTVQPGQSEEMGILNAMFNDTDGVMSDERKMEFYKLYIPQLYRRGEISEEVYEGMKEDIFGEGKAEGGIMDLGGREMDMRGGGFIPIGKKERADDVPARLSKNEFVMTADAVRAAGGGSVNEGAKRMYETMNRLEARA
jgi:hypothetical protein